MLFQTTLIDLNTGEEHSFSHILTIGTINYYVTTTNKFLRLNQFLIKNDLVTTLNNVKQLNLLK